MIHSRNRRVLLLIETSRAYGRGLVEGICEYADKHVRWALYFEERGLFDPLPSWLKQWHGHGVIARSPKKTCLKRIIELKLPTVELYAGPHLGHPCVYVDQAAVARMAAEHFIERGIRAFAFFANETHHWIDQRREAFVNYLGHLGHQCHVYSVMPASKRNGSDRLLRETKRIAAWMSKLPKPCGVFCASDIFALRISGICRDLGIVVPDQAAILGVDNDPVLCKVAHPPLSSIDVQSQRIGYEAAKMLDRLMNGEAVEYPIFIDPSGVVIRESTDVLAIGDPEVAGAVRFIRNRASQGIQVGEVSAATAISRRMLERRFRDCLGRSVKQEILSAQIDHAKILLRQTELSIGSVAKKSGFAFAQNFSVLFHRIVGLTPLNYRRQYINRQEKI
jgi:LacI family transcriptional regulator